MYESINSSGSPASGAGPSGGGGVGNIGPQYSGGLGGMASPAAKAAETLGKTKGAKGNDAKGGPPDVMKWLEDFFAQLNAPLDFDDPFVQNILMHARNSTMQSANNAGVFGPYSQNQAEQAWIRGAAGLQQQKQNNALSAAGLLSGRQQFEENLDYEKNKDAHQAGLDRWKWDQENSLGSRIGGGLGAIGGGIAGIFGGDIAGGAKAGFDIGRGIGGGFGATPPPSFNPYKSPGGY